MVVIAIAVAVMCFWLICSFAAYGFLFAYDQCHFPNIAAKDRRSDMAFDLGLSLAFGPIVLVMSFFLTGFWEHGWRLK